MVEAEFGNLAQARDGAHSALTMDRSRRTLGSAGLAQSMAGDISQATATADELSKRFPTDTFVNNVWVPVNPSRD